MARLHPLAALLAGLALAADQAIPLGSDGCNHTMQRAGCPDQLSPCARPTNTPEYCGYYVGGGCAFHGGPPGPLEGTFGWDYCCLHHWNYHVILGWCHRYQNGIGSYRTDFIHIPNVFAVKLPRRAGACPAPDHH